MDSSTSDHLRALVKALDSAQDAASQLTDDGSPKATKSFGNATQRALKSMAEDARSLLETVEVTDWGSIEKATWPTSYVDKLPDSAFLYVAPGGKKDGEGKTTPRSLRHLPVRDSAGKPDEAHVRDALSRATQADIPEEAKVKAVAEAKRLLAGFKKAG